MATTTTAAAPPYRSYIEPRADAEFPAEKGRYHLYVTYSCPFACRALAARDLLGLQDAIGLSVAHPVFQKTKPLDESDTHLGWTFVDPVTSPSFTGYNGKQYSSADCIPDTVNGATFVRDLYEKVDMAPRRYTVPLLWDKKKQTIVSNESADILRTLNSGFRELVPSKVDLVPAAREAELNQVNEVNECIVAALGTAFYKIVSSQDAETKAQGLAQIHEELRKLDGELATKRFLLGGSITEPDVRAFHSLIRIDVASPSKTLLTDYANIVGYLRELYQAYLKSTVNWQHLQVSGANRNPDAEPSAGPYVDYDAPHDRARL